MSCAVPTLHEEMVGWFRAIVDPDQAVEVRAPKCRKPGARKATNVVEHFVAGRVEEMVQRALELSGRAPGIYFTLNPVGLPLGNGRTSTTDADITRRRRLLVDCDPRRDSEVSATDDEKAAALVTMAEVRDFLASLEFPDPIEADSGNGGHLAYAIDLPNDDASRDLVQAVLRELARRFDSPAVAIDTSVYNASRIAKLYGTMACKGPDSAERPHRLSRVLRIPKAFTPVPLELIESLVIKPAEGRKLDFPTITVSPRKGGMRAFGSGPLDPAERAARYLDTMDPAISGNGGHNRAFRAACRVGPGFDLPLDVALRLLRDRYNPRCEPPWSDRELLHKVEDAYKKEDRRGWLLNTDRNASTNGHTNGNGHANGYAEGARHDPRASSDPSGEVRYEDLSPADLGMIRATEIKPESINWLWKYRLARGGMALVAGDGGLGKSQILLAIAAAISAGGKWPDGTEGIPAGDVVILSAEDRPGDTIIPRLMAMGADLSRVTILRAEVILRRPGKDPMVHPMDFQRLDYFRAVFDKLPDCKLFVVDPVPSYLGRGVNDSKNSEVRAVLEPFIRGIIEPRDISMLCNTHMNKATDAKTPVHRVIGSVAYANLARNVHVVARDPEDPMRRFFGQPKCNNAPDGLPSMAFRVEGREVVGWDGELIETGVPVFEPELVSISIQELVNGKGRRDGKDEQGGRRGPSPEKCNKFAEWLWNQLQAGPVALTDLIGEARDEGLLLRPDPPGTKQSISPLYNARDRIPTLYPGHTVEQFEAVRGQGSKPLKHWKIEPGMTKEAPTTADFFDDRPY